jgi:hypothetical protein
MGRHVVVAARVGQADLTASTHLAGKRRSQGGSSDEDEAEPGVKRDSGRPQRHAAARGAAKRHRQGDADASNAEDAADEDEDAHSEEAWAGHAAHVVGSGHVVDGALIARAGDAGQETRGQAQAAGG